MTDKIVSRKATIRDVPYVVQNLLPEGLQDFRRAGIHPVFAIAADTLNSDTYLLSSPRGIPIGLVGVTKSGCIWMNMTNEIRKYPKEFILFAKDFVRARGPLLWNEVDIQNNNLRKFLRLIGFKIINVIPSYGGNYYVQFAMVNNE
mgnify:CR=1 FL=1